VVAVTTLRPEGWGPAGSLANGFLAAPTLGVTTDDLQWGEGGVALAWYTGEGTFVQNEIGTMSRVDLDTVAGLPDPYAVMGGIGVSAYAPGIELHVLDLLGLADTIASHLEVPVSGRGDAYRFPGHEKPLPTPWVAARITAPGSRPDAADLTDFPTPLIPPTTGAEFEEQVAWARAALGCDAIAELWRAATAPLGPRRFLDNVVGSFANTFVRIPPDPEDAYREHCGPGVPPEVEAVRAAGGA
jgi:arabinofuranosyltransferase